MADEKRIVVLEQHVRSLYEQIAALRAELGAREGASSATPGARRPAMPPVIASAVEAEPTPSSASATKVPAEPGSPSPPPRPLRASTARQTPDIDLEALLGRYGTIAVASLAILMGVGTFLSWAIEHGLLGPVVRVVLGFVAAAVVAGVGVWVRERHDVRFGNVLLALSLAIVHLDAWAAGPHLHVLRTVVALAIAAAASAALAALALTSEERTLFAIGFAGALLAPFVTASEPGNVVMLLTYGWVVIASSLFAIRERGWRPVLWLTVIGAAVYVVAAAESPGVPDVSWLGLHAPVLFGFACAAAALLWARDMLRSKLALAFLLIACGTIIGYSMGAPKLEVALPLAGTLAAYLIARELETEQLWLVIGNIILPLGFLAATLLSANDRSIHALAAVALTVIAALLAFEADDEERPHHLFVTAVASSLAIAVYLIGYDARCIGALALHAALFSVVLRWTRAKILVAPLLVELLLASTWALNLLQLRAPYAYRPFGGVPSLCALAVVGGWTVLAFALKPTKEERAPEDAALWSLLSGIAIVAAFVWVRQELVEAYSRDFATFSLIVYYALAGLALIFAGRWRRVGAWRAAGLALAFYAGYKALAETFTIDAIAYRVGARILVGIFLAAVAYWYRAPREPEPEAPTTDESPTGAPASHSSL